MITVIIPTMWKSDLIRVMLPKVNDHPLVGEIILIDNDPEKKIEEICKLSKVNYVTFGENIFPVASWNHGWKNAKYEKLVIINDDIDFNTKVFDLVYDKITPEIGMISPDPNIIGSISNQISENTESLSIVETKDLKHKTGIFIAIHKDTYEEIPSDFKIYFNDTWLFAVATTRKKQNYNIIQNKTSRKEVNQFYFRTSMSTTVNHFKKITQNEWKIWEEVFNKHGIPTR